MVCRVTLILSFCVIAMFPCNGQSQQIDAIKRFGALEKNKDSHVISTEDFSEYIFSVEKQGIEIEHKNAQKLVSQIGSTSHTSTLFYNDNIEVNSYSVRDSKDRQVYYERTCGNFEQNSIFYSDAKVCTYRYHFQKQDSELTFFTSVIYKDPRYLTRVMFHSGEPTMKSIIEFTVPDEIETEFVEMNFATWNIQKEVIKNKKGTTYRYTLNNLFPIKSEPHSLGNLHNLPHLIVLTKKYKSSKGDVPVIASVQDLYSWYHSLVKDVKNDQTVFKKEVERLIATCKSEEEKIKAIYYWVQDNIRYIAFEDGIAGFKPAPAQEVYTNRFGDCKGMANLTKEMLKVAGIDARITWIGTNRLPYNYDIPSLCVDNHMICTIPTKEKLYILDPTEKFIDLGSNGERIQGKEMLIENGDQFLRKRVPEADYKKNSVLRSEQLKYADGLLQGNGNIQFNGESKVMLLNFSAETSKEDASKMLSYIAVAETKNTDEVLVKNKPTLDRDKPFEVSYSYSLHNAITSYGDDLYVDLDWEKPFRETEIENNRITDYYFGEKIHKKIVKKMEIPSGYKVTNLPAGINYTGPGFSFTIKFENSNNMLLYDNEIIITNGMIRKEDFSEWNKGIEKLRNMYDEQIVLTKVK